MSHEGILPGSVEPVQKTLDRRHFLAMAGALAGSFILPRSSSADANIAPADPEDEPTIAMIEGIPYEEFPSPNFPYRTQKPLDWEYSSQPSINGKFQIDTFESSESLENGITTKVKMFMQEHHGETIEQQADLVKMELEISGATNIWEVPYKIKAGDTFIDGRDISGYVTVEDGTKIERRRAVFIYEDLVGRVHADYNYDMSETATEHRKFWEMWINNFELVTK